MMSNQQHKRRRIDSESTATTAAPDTTDTNDVTATNAAGGGGGASSSSSSKGHKVVPERVSWVVHPEEPDELEAGTPSDTLAALLLLLSELPALGPRVPRLVPRHTLYTVVDDKTEVDKEIGRLIQRRIVKLFKIGAVGNDYLVLADEFRQHVKSRSDDANADATDRLLQIVLKHQGVSVTKKDLTSGEAAADDTTITTLIRTGLLLHRDRTSFWLAVPNAGVFMKDLRKGRDTLLRMLKRAKFKEVLQHDLLNRKLKGSALGMRFHIADVVGMGAAERIKTTSGDLIRWSG